MKRIFNLQKQTINKNAFYDGAQAGMKGETRAFMNCWKAKVDKGISPQKAWEGCKDEFQKARSDEDWAKKYM